MTIVAKRVVPSAAIPAGAPNQLLLLSAFTVSTAGDWLYRLGLPLLVLKLTGSAVSTATAYALEYVPYIFFSMLGGVAADRFDRRRLLVLGDFCSALIVGGLAALVMLGFDQIWSIYLVAFALSSVRPFYHPAFQSILPSLIPAEGLTRTNARIQSIDSVLSFAGPVLGAGAVAALGAISVLWLDALSFLFSACIIVWIRGSAPPAPAAAGGDEAGGRGRIRHDLLDAARYLRRDRVTLAASLLMAGTNVGLLMIEANMVFYVVRLRGLPISAVGIVFGAYGIGAVLGAMAAPRLCRRFRAGHLIVAGMLGAGVMTALLGLLPGLTGAALAWGAVGLFVMTLVVTWFSLRQRIVPQRLLGRVVALSRMLSFATIPPAAAIGGVLLSLGAGAWPAIGTAAAIQIAISLIAVSTALWSARFPSAPPQEQEVPS